MPSTPAPHFGTAASETQALAEARLTATQLNTVVDRIEARQEAPEATVRHLVAGFLLPEVERRTLRDAVTHDQKRFRRAAGLAVSGGLRGQLSAAVDGGGSSSSNSRGQARRTRGDRGRGAERVGANEVDTGAGVSAAGSHQSPPS